MLWSRGLKGMWRLENTALDGSGNANHGTVHGATYTDGQFGRCLSFNGTTDYVDLPSELIPKTVTLWTNFNLVSHTNYFLGGKPTTFSGIRYDGTTFLVFTGGQHWSAVAWAKQDALVHFAALLSATTYDIYINGSFVGTGNLGTGGDDLRLGRFGSRVDGYFFPGPLDEINFWNRALTQPDIRRVMMGMSPIS